MLLFTFIMAVFVTMLTIPLLMRVAPRLGLVDLPDPRKVHKQPIPRCGGIGIAVGAALPILMWSNPDRFTLGYLAGAAVILAFGIWDDIKNLSYKWKFAGQFLAVGIVLAVCGPIQHLPLFGIDPAPAWIAYPVSLLFILGVTNAVNLFDGLDGLAGGCALLSLCAIAFLAWQGGQGGAVPLIALAMVGGILGFLRYNSYPAVIFMGDAGSQVLGFTAAVLAMQLIEHAHQALSPAVLIMLLGLPIMDTLSVMTERIANGRSPFSPDKNHTHHKFLALGFRHYEAVSIIYVIQTLLVVSAYMLRYSSDIVLMGSYLSICAGVLGFLYWARRSGWTFRPAPETAAETERRNLTLRRLKWLPGALGRALTYAVGLFLVAGAVAPAAVSDDYATVALATLAAALPLTFLPHRHRGHAIRISLYVTAGLVAYLLAAAAEAMPLLDWGLKLHMGLIVVLLALGIRVTRQAWFRVTPQDLLVAIFALTLPNLPNDLFAQYHLGVLVPVLVVVFYTSEFLLRHQPEKNVPLRASALLALGIIVLRGLT